VGDNVSHLSAVPRFTQLSALEHEVMTIVWRRGSATATQVMEDIDKPLTNATVRTLLRRLEAKGYVRHAVHGRAFVYSPKVAEAKAATGAVRRIVQRFFAGSTSKLLAGMVDEGLIDPEDLRRLSRRIERSSGGARNRASSLGGSKDDSGGSK
jgi:predicted transcriptional regulator